MSEWFKSPLLLPLPLLLKPGEGIGVPPLLRDCDKDGMGKGKGAVHS